MARFFRPVFNITSRNFYKPSSISVFRNGSSLFYNSYRMMADVTFKIEDFGGAETVNSGDLYEWLKKEGDYVNVDDELCAIETEKATVNPTSPDSGILKKILVKEGESVHKGDALWVIDTDGKPPKEDKPVEKKEEPKSEPKSESKETPKKGPKPSHAAPGTETRVKMSKMRETIGKRLKDSQNTAAMLTTFQECDMSELMKMRSEYKDKFLATHGVKLGFMSCFVKASSIALLKERSANAYIDGNEIVYKDYVDINIAVATPNGLVTPLLRDCDKMSFAEIELEIQALAAKGRSKKITMNDLASGTFTISNGGVYGSMMGTPILNPPQSAILGMHAITKRPVVVNDEIVIRPMMYLALTYDHRILDGKSAVTFLKTIKENIEDPRRLVLDL